ncbi:MAG: hypothetical protein WC993_00135 [Methanoculleus sp.]
MKAALCRSGSVGCSLDRRCGDARAYHVACGHPDGGEAVSAPEKRAGRRDTLA